MQSGTMGGWTSEFLKVVASPQKNGSWGKAELVKEPYINMHVGSVALNYGQSVSEIAASRSCFLTFVSGLRRRKCARCQGFEYTLIYNAAQSLPS